MVAVVLTWKIELGGMVGKLVERKSDEKSVRGED
jgi:hypothetical protein